ncbi:hypothetical protein A4G99_15510 [Haladaptatus sp. R4]|nr:hypothetical protein A4G99_15510 [Haladaptatus sp. R4]
MLLREAEPAAFPLVQPVNALDVERQVVVRTVIVRSRQRTVLRKQRPDVPHSVPSERRQNGSLLFDQNLHERLDGIYPVHLVQPFAVEFGDQPNVRGARVALQRPLYPLAVGIFSTHPDERHDSLGVVSDDSLDFERQPLYRRPRFPEREFVRRNFRLYDDTHDRY